MVLTCGSFVVSTVVAVGNINLEWRVSKPAVRVGDTVEAGLYVVSDSAADQALIAMDAILNWDPDVLALVGKADDGAFPWPVSQFPNDSPLDGLNADCWPHTFCSPYTFLPFNDGDALYEAFVLFVPDPPPIAPPEGARVTTILFTALQPTAGTRLEFLASAGDFSFTRVLNSVDGQTQDVTGVLHPLSLPIVACGAAGDFDGDCVLDRVDWSSFTDCMAGPEGGYGGPGCLPADTDGDGDSDLRDAAFLQLMFTGP